jgi:hypothetical protein
VQSRAETFARTWGEVVSKTTAAKMLGCSRKQIYRLIEQGHLKQSADGRIFTREAAEYTEKGKAAVKKWRLVK